MPNPELVGLAGAAVLAWLLLLLVARWATRPADVQPGPEGLDLGPEPPAVVNLLTGGWRLSQDATAATLIDLAARDIIGLEQHGPEAEHTVCRVRDPKPARLTPYERRVFNRVITLADGGVVPAAALVRGDEAWARTWWRRFQKEVIADACGRGLSRDRWSRATLATLRLAAAVPAVLTTVVVLSGRLRGKNGQQEIPIVYALFAGVLVWALLAWVVSRLSDQRDTEAGRVAAAHWLGYRDHLARDESFPRLPPAAVAIWDRHLAYAAALGIARTAVRVLPLGARSETRAWSAYGGSWHQVRIRYPSGLWGAAPWRVAFRGLFQTSVASVGLSFMLRLRGEIGADLDGIRSGLDRWAWALDVPLALAALVLALGVRNLLRAAVEYPSRRPLEGEVVRLVARAVGDSDNRSYVYYAGIDDGRRPRTRAYRLSTEQYRRLDEGDEVRLVAGRWLGRLFELEVTREQAPPPATEALPAAPAGQAGLSAGAGPVAGGIMAAALAGRLGEGADSAADLDPAGLLRPEDVAAVLGVQVMVRPVGPRGGVPFLKVRMCAYSPVGGGQPTLLVQVASGGLAGRMTGAAQARRDPVPGVPGGYFFQRGRQHGVVVVHGHTTVAIGSSGANVDRAVLAGLAAPVAARLGAALPGGA